MASHGLEIIPRPGTTFRLATQMVLNLGVSGISFVGADVGGFNGSPSSQSY